VGRADADAADAVRIDIFQNRGLKGGDMSRRFGARGRAATMLVLAGLLLTALLGSATPALGAQQSILRIAQVAAPDSLNPFATYAAFFPQAWIYDPLVGVDAQRHTDRRGFAQSWSVSSDGLTWTFKIWPNMKWSDGQPATAQDAYFTYNYIRNSIGKADELNTGWDSTSGFSVISSINVVNSTTLTITTTHPTTWPIDNTTLIVPQHVWQNISYADARSSFKNPPPTVGTGPLIASDWPAAQDEIIFKPNPYFRNGKPKYDEAVFRYFTSSDPMVQSLESGGLDYAYGLTPAQALSVKGLKNVKLDKVKIEQQDYMAFNTASGTGAGSTAALTDPAFRDAVGYAIDLNAIVSRGYDGFADVGAGPIIPLSPYFTNLADIKRHFSLATAQQKLDAAGYKLDGSGVRVDKQGHEIRLNMITGTPSGMNPVPDAVPELIVGWLGQIGIPVTVTHLDSGAMYAKTNDPSGGGGGWDLAVAGRWYSPDPTTLLSIASGPASGDNNVSYWSNSQYDNLVNQISTTVDKTQLKSLVDQASTIAYQQAPYIFLDYPYNLSGYRTDHFVGWMKPEAAAMWSYAPWDRLSPINVAASSSQSGAPIAAIVIGIVIVLIVVGIVLLIVMRRRTYEVE
jgi:peptide/nickel transport system substrate-binding protein